MNHIMPGPIESEMIARAKAIRLRLNAGPPKPRDHAKFHARRPFWIQEIEKVADLDIITAETPACIIREVAAKHGLTAREILGPWRERRFVMARHEAMYWCRQLTSLSYPALAREFEREDHTTIMSGCKSHERRLRELESENA